MKEEYLLFGSPIQQSHNFNDQSTLLNLEMNVKTLQSKKTFLANKLPSFMKQSLLSQDFEGNIQDKYQQNNNANSKGRGQIMQGKYKWLYQDPNQIERLNEEIQRLKKLDTKKINKLTGLLDKLIQTRKYKNDAAQDLFPNKISNHLIRSQEPKEKISKYYKSKEEIYRRFNFNDDSKIINQKFKQKEELIKQNIKDKQIAEKPEVARLIDKIKELENPLINQLLLEKVRQTEKKERKVIKAINEAEKILNQLDEKQDKIYTINQSRRSHAKSESRPPQSAQPSIKFGLKKESKASEQNIISPDFEIKHDSRKQSSQFATSAVLLQTNLDDSESISGKENSLTEYQPESHSMTPVSQNLIQKKISSSPKIQKKNISHPIKDLKHSRNDMVFQFKVENLSSLQQTKEDKNKNHSLEEIKERQKTEKGNLPEQNSSPMNQTEQFHKFPSQMFKSSHIKAQSSLQIFQTNQFNHHRSSGTLKSSNNFETPIVSYSSNIKQLTAIPVKISVSSNQTNDYFLQSKKQ